MKKLLFSILATLMSCGISAQSRMVPNPVFLSFTDQEIYTNDVEWDNEESVTKFIKAHVPDIRSYYTFANYRTNQDKKGFRHYDCQQKNETNVSGRELIVHTDDKGRLLYITGDIKGSASYAKGSVQSDDKCLASSAKGQTEEAVSESSLPSLFGKATEAASLTGTPFYQDRDVMIDPTIDGAMLNGKYVLQDLGRNIYTIDYSDHVVASNAAKQGKPAFIENTFLELLKEGNLDDILSYGNNFESSTADFGSEHDSMTSRVSSVTIENAYIFTDPETGNTLDGEFRFEIRKCKDTDLVWEGYEFYGTPLIKVSDYSKAWDNGTTLATSTATSPEGQLKFSFDNMEFTKVSAERDANYEEHLHEAYVGALTYGDKVLAYISIKNRSTDESGSTEITVNGHEDYLIYSIQRQLVKVQPVIDIHWGLERTIDIYKQQFGINSFDNKGTAVVALVNNSNSRLSMPNNSCANSDNKKLGVMAFGLGSSSPDDNMMESMNGRMFPIVNISTIGHEFTHLVASKLYTYYESGALHESYADIIGKMVERYALKPHCYLCGDKEVNTVSWEVAPMTAYTIPQNGQRRMDDPNLYDNPKYYKGKYWDTPREEMHINAGVQNYWFYLLCNGGDITPEQGETVSITPIDRDSAEFIAFSSLMYFVTKYTDYAMARKNSITATKLYFGDDSKELDTVLKAWYAVGVGTDEWKPGDPASIDAVYSNNSLTIANATRKVIDNGKLIIIKNGKRYSATGQEL